MWLIYTHLACRSWLIYFSHYFAYYRTCWRLNGKWQLVPHAANTVNTFSANPFHSKTYHHTYKSTRKTENYGKVLRFQSEKINKKIYILYCQACISIVLFTEKLEQVTEQLFSSVDATSKLGFHFLMHAVVDQMRLVIHHSCTLSWINRWQSALSYHAILITTRKV